MGKDGSQWKHGYVPENAAATALKMHRKPGGGSGGSSTAKKATVSKATVSKGSASDVYAPGLTQGYAKGHGATDADVAELSRRYQLMHGKPPTAAMVAKIKRAKPAAKPKAKAKPAPKMKTQSLGTLPWQKTQTSIGVMPKGFVSPKKPKSRKSK